MSRFRQTLLAGWALLTAAAATAWGAVTLQDLHVTNVGTTTFDVVWTTSEVSTPGLDVFADSEGTVPLNDTVALEFYPLAEGDTSVVNDAEARAARRSLEQLAINRRVVVARVSGLEPGTSYYVRARSFDATGADNSAAVLPLLPATTAEVTSLVPESRLLRVRFPAVAAEGMVALVFGPEGTLPLSMIVGDSTDGDTALIPLANLMDALTGTNAVLSGPQPITIRLLGADAPSGEFTQTLEFSNTFSVAQAQVIDTDLSSPAPFFTAQPADATAAVGATANFTAAATGTPAPSYRWQRKAAGTDAWYDLSDNATYAGSSNASLTISALTLAMSGDQFRARAFNGVPPEALSDEATLTVTTLPVPPLILEHPAPMAVLQGEPATFAATASGSPEPTYQWQRKAAGAGAWSDLLDDAIYAGAQTSTLTVQATVLAMHGDAFRVIASNGQEPDAVSTDALLSVSAAAVAPTITQHPQAQEVVQGGVATFTAEATGVPTPQLQWQHKPAGSGAWADLPENATYVGVTTGSLSINAVTAGMSGDEFRVVASNGTAPDATSAAAILSVLTPPTITTQPEGASVAAGANAGFTVVATGSGTLAYRWQRLAAGAAEWTDLAEGPGFTGTATANLTVTAAPLAMNGDQFRVIVSNDVGATTSEAATLAVINSVATIELSNLRQRYDGTPKTVGVVTAPANLDVDVTYNGSATLPTVPGVYAVEAQITEPGYSGSVSGELVIFTDVVVRRAPTLDGGVDGSVQVLNPESFTVKGWISGDLLMPGTPTIIGGNNPTYGGTIDGPGASTPTSHSVTLAATAALSHVVRRVDAGQWPTVPNVALPTGTRNVTLTSPTQSPGDFSTIRNLTIAGTAGRVIVPAGTYGGLTTNGNSRFVLGVEGATQPAEYNVQMLLVNTMGGAASVEIVGPVILNVQNSVVFGGPVGASQHPEWLRINVVKGGLTINGSATLYGSVVVPAGVTALYGTSSVEGTIVTDRLVLSSGAEVRAAAPVNE